MTIDSHQHFWKFDPVRDSWINQEMSVLRKDYFPQDLLPSLRRNNIDGTVAVQADQSEQETLFLVRQAETCSFIKGVVGWVDLRADDLPERLEFFSQFPVIKGFRHIVQSEPDGFLSDKRFAQGVRTLGEHGFTYDLLVYHHQLPEAIDFLAAVEEVTIVLDHLAKPPIASGEKTKWELDISAVATFRNVHCKISGMVTEAAWKKWEKEDFFPYLDELMEAFGPTRLMYGSDWPVCLLSASYEEQLGIVSDYISGLSLSEQQAIMGKNAVAVYKL